MKRFEHKLKEKNSKIVELESKFAMKQTTIDNIEIKCDVTNNIPENRAYVFMALISSAMKIIIS